jgi:hypothetical protein
MMRTRMVARHPWSAFASALVLALACQNKDAPTPASEPSAAPIASPALAVPSGLASVAPSPAPSPVESAPPAPSASVAEPRARPSKTVAGASTTVKLLEPGSEPRRELRYAYDKGRVERARLVSGTSLTMEVAGQKLELPAMPDLEMNAVIRIVELLPSGSARRRLTIDKVDLKKGGLDPSLQGDVEKALARLEGLKGRDLIDRRGFIHELELEKIQAQPELRQFLESMQQALGQMGAPFPEEAVGKGARWRIETKVSQQGLELRQSATYELVELEGDQGRTKMELRQRSPAGSVNPPGLPPGVKAELLSLDSRGSGELRFDLGRMVPDGHVTTKSKIKVRTELPTGGTQDATMNVMARATFAPK